MSFDHGVFLNYCRLAFNESEDLSRYIISAIVMGHSFSNIITYIAENQSQIKFNFTSYIEDLIRKIDEGEVLRSGDYVFEYSVLKPYLNYFQSLKVN